MAAPPLDVTELLHDWSQGDPSALEKLIPLVFEDLRQIAARMFRRESDGHTLQPTALVNEVYLRLMDQRKIHWANRQQFFGVAALLMRRILVDYAKGRQAVKRGSGAVKLPLDEALGLAVVQDNVDVIALDEALSRLAEIDPRQGQIVEMRYFTGLSHEEIAEVLGVSVTTVKREWKTARLWLHRELTKK
ncbi:MAG TPA: sigma-70 family RNA polymerase sigma factor [Thermoanaerobaculia bacterium]|nr:sigma-70 family RNA polymerase sigma factor [Thermoanaerobaculia bacterium]